MAQRAAQFRLEDEIRYLSARLEQLELRVAELESQRGEFELVGGVEAFDPLSSSEPSLPELSLERENILKQIGVWLKSTLEGRRRGLSGREQLPESSTCYLVLRNFAGKTFNPVKVSTSFGEIVNEVKQGGSTRDSVFIGLPSLRDAKVVVQAAGLSWPASRGNA